MWTAVPVLYQLCCYQMLLLIQKLLSSESFNDVVAMATLLQTLTVMVSSLGSVSSNVQLTVQLCHWFWLTAPLCYFANSANS